jgi:hypothetical protein
MAHAERDAAAAAYDTERLHATLGACEQIGDHTQYVVHVQRGHRIDESWQLLKRYSDFRAWHARLQARGAAPCARTWRLSLGAVGVMGNKRMASSSC